jgi:hypothetical protein
MSALGWQQPSAGDSRFAQDVTFAKFCRLASIGGNHSAPAHEKRMFIEHCGTIAA